MIFPVIGMNMRSNAEKIRKNTHKNEHLSTDVSII